MNPDTFSYCITIASFQEVLTWLILICAIGVVIVGYAMMAFNSFYFLLITDKEGKSTYAKFSTRHFEIPYSPASTEAMITSMSDKMKDTVRWKLKLDYYFMPFLYLLIYFAGVYCFRYCFAGRGDQSGWLLWTPFIGWVMDILENKTASSSLVKASKSKLTLLFIFSLLKWVSILGFVIMMAVLAMLR